MEQLGHQKVPKTYKLKFSIHFSIEQQSVKAEDFIYKFPDFLLTALFTYINWVKAIRMELGHCVSTKNKQAQILYL